MGAYHEFGLFLGEAMPKNCSSSSPTSTEFLVSAEWSKCELEALVTEGIVQYRAAAATARRAHNRWCRLVGAVDEAEFSNRLEEYRHARAICEARRITLNHLINQLGYIPTIAASPSPLQTESQ